ncbi:MAG: calcium-binding protein, partial [Paracoccaceae bacterium]
DQLSGGDDGDFVYGGAASDGLRGGAGDDLVDGGLGNDTIRGDGGDDTLTGDDGVDSILGGLGADEIFGDASQDRLFGGDGNDTISGGASFDTMSGGLGQDTFVFEASNVIGINVGSRDVIGDFRAGVDLIDLSLIDANTVLAANQAFAFIGATAFSSVAGQLRYSAVDGLLQGDTNGNGTADFAIEIGNRPVLTVLDLLL